MNCKTCGGTTVAKNTSRGQAFECNQDNGDCFGNNGYPTTTWGTSLRQNGGGQQNPRRAPISNSPPQQQRPAANGPDLSKWQTCLNCAARVFGGTSAPVKDVIAFARELYAAKPATAAKPAPKPAPPEPEPDQEPQEDEPQVF